MLFITLAFVIRIIEALGNAAFLTASFAIIAKEFPDKVSLTFASLETFFGLGLIGERFLSARPMESSTENSRFSLRSVRQQWAH